MNVRFVESRICCIAMPFLHLSSQGLAPKPAAGSKVRKILSMTFSDIGFPIWFPSSGHDTTRLNLFGKTPWNLIISSFRIRRPLEVIHCPLDALLVIHGDRSNQHFARSLLESHVIMKSRFMGSRPSLIMGMTKHLTFCTAFVKVSEGVPVCASSWSRSSRKSENLPRSMFSGHANVLWPQDLIISHMYILLRFCGVP